MVIQGGRREGGRGGKDRGRGKEGGRGEGKEKWSERENGRNSKSGDSREERDRVVINAHGGQI